MQPSNHNNSTQAEKSALMYQMKATSGAVITPMEQHIKAVTLWCPMTTEEVASMTPNASNCSSFQSPLCPIPIQMRHEDLRYRTDLYGRCLLKQFQQ
jgi:hypothetical protein